MSVRFPSLSDADKAIDATALAKGFGVATEKLGDFRRKREARQPPDSTNNP
jgi:hypothetical protein